MSDGDRKAGQPTGPVTHGPETKALFTSGYHEGKINAGYSLDVGIDYLQKPYLPRMLLVKVRELLDR